jgi:tRNA-uridine 2-sulfurtransferase
LPGEFSFDADRHAASNLSYCLVCFKQELDFRFDFLLKECFDVVNSFGVHVEVSRASDIMRPMKGQTPKKVYVGMSGGVDSSVSAALLKEHGFDVTGVFIKVWQPDWMECNWREDRLDAMRVCVHLGIPFKTLDLEKEYKKEVVDYMIAEYKAGRTPNPDIMCNRHVKFGGFFDWAMREGADYIATGHYAQITDHRIQITEHQNRELNEMLRAPCSVLRMGLDEGKDQSYFLWTLTQRELSKTLFPVGGMEKSQTRKLARKFKLPVAEKRDSQGLCFIGKVDIKEFLSHYIEGKKGDVIDEKGNVIGSHDGALFLTLGERHGFTIENKISDEKPYYVVARDLEKNTVTVSHKSAEGHLQIEKKEYGLIKTNWVSGGPQKGKSYQARIRHLGELFDCIIDAGKGDIAKIAFEKPLIIASGQSTVIYSNDTCIGGGIVM